MEELKIPAKIQSILGKLQEADYKAYLVGGCVRDLLLGKTPQDWDIATSAKPEEIQKLFPKNFYDNQFGTVTVLPDLVEITTFRKEAQYSDKRHPDQIEFTDQIEEDLQRRDFTINALAYDGKNLMGRLEPIIKAVGDPDKRFQEDALRLLRAVRFAVQLELEIEDNTLKSIKNNSQLLNFVAPERIRDELVKIIMSESPKKGILLLKELNLLKFIIPELELGVGISQNKHHIYTVFEHALNSLHFAALKGFNLAVRLAALFHDIAKPQTKTGSGKDASFINHDIVGAKWASRILKRLKFENKIIDQVYLLVRRHMFLSDPEKVTDAGARRLLRKVGQENIGDLINLRIADRLGSGVAKDRPYRLRHFEYMLSKVSRDPISVKMLKINGNDLLRILQIKPSPQIGLILRALLNEVLDDPKKNSQEYLERRAKELNKLSERELNKKTREVAEKKEGIEEKEKKKFWL